MAVEITSKDEIVRQVSDRLKEDSYFDLNQFIIDNCPDYFYDVAFIRDVAHKMKRTGKFDFIVQSESGRYIIIPLPPKNWAERNPFFRDIIVTLCAAILSLIVGLLLEKSDSQQQHQRDIQQATEMRVLRDSVNTLWGKVDSLKKK